MIIQIPVISLVFFLLMALIVPLFKRRNFAVTTTLGLIVLLIVWVLTVVLVRDVYLNGPFTYAFGNHESFIGLELLVNLFSAGFALFMLSLIIIIYVYSTSDATEGIAEKEYGRYYILLFILLFAMFGILYTNDLFNTYVFMEILSITTVSIISIKRKKENYTASFRYVMLNEVGSLSYLFGVALLFMVTGHTNIDLVAASIQSSFDDYTANIVTALGFMLTGIGIKAAIFPFHIWLPDAHSTAPTSSSAILSGLVVKLYILIMIKMLFRLFGFDIVSAMNIHIVLMMIGAFGMIMGSVFAIGQTDVKRMLGYSSIAQVGYIVLGISLGTVLGLQAAFFHVLSHGLMKAALFLSVGAVIYHKGVRKVKDFNGMASEMPVVMTVFGLAALGMIGIPLTSGFISKLNLGLASLDANQGYLIIIIIVSGLLNALYYLPILIAAFLKSNKPGDLGLKVEPIPRLMMVPIVVLGLLIVYFGLFPNMILSWFEEIAVVLL